VLKIVSTLDVELIKVLILLNITYNFTRLSDFVFDELILGNFCSNIHERRHIIQMLLCMDIREYCLHCAFSILYCIVNFSCYNLDYN